MGQRPTSRDRPRRGRIPRGDHPGEASGRVWTTAAAVLSPAAAVCWVHAAATAVSARACAPRALRFFSQVASRLAPIRRRAAGVWWPVSRTRAALGAAYANAAPGAGSTPAVGLAVFRSTASVTGPSSASARTSAVSSSSSGSLLGTRRESTFVPSVSVGLPIVRRTGSNLEGAASAAVMPHPVAVTRPDRDGLGRLVRAGYGVARVAWAIRASAARSAVLNRSGSSWCGM